MATTEYHDLVIIGSGPAGLSASIYATRAMLDAITIEQTTIGGQVITTNEIDNYPGVPNTTGFELMDLMEKQARDLGAQIVMDNIVSIEKDQASGIFTIVGGSASYTAKAVIFATGATPRHAGFENEDKFAGRGVSYCGTCDGMFYRGKHVFAIGGGNTAVEDALFLTRFADKVTMVVRKDHFRAQPALIKRLEENEKVNIRYQTSIVKVDGNQLLNEVTFRNNVTGEQTTEKFDEGSFGIFVFVGQQPASEVLGDLVDKVANGAIITDEHMATKTEGLFVAGDVRATPLRQIITAAADGAIAATSASSFLGIPVDC